MGLRITEEELLALQQKRRAAKLKRPKFGNTKAEIDGLKFDSKKEGQYYVELKLREKAGEVTDIVLQKPFEVVVNGKKICKYIADFQFIEKGETIVVDVKSPATRKLPVYRLKKKLVEAIYGISITEA